MSSQVVVVGVTHRTAPIEVRERLAVSNGAVEAVLGDLLVLPDVHEAVVLSTCNRTEVVVCCPPDTDPVPNVGARLLELGGLDAGEHGQNLFSFSGREAVRHVFRVAASLDSLVVGEPQILGQMKEQFALSAKANAAGPVLHRVFHKGFSVAKRVRTETAVAGRSISIASVAVDLARKIFETLDGRSVLLIGTGDIGELAARNFAAAGAARLMVANRTFEPAVALARALAGTPVPYDRMPMYLPLADLVVGCTGGGECVRTEDVRRSMRERQNRPVFFIDLAVPRNFDPAINALDNVYLYTVDDLASVVEENLGERQREAVEGEAIVEEEVDKFWRWFEKLDVVPTLVQLRDWAEEVRADEVARTVSRLGLPLEQRERIDQMTRTIVNKLLHPPTAELKKNLGAGEEFALLTALRKLFGLERNE